MLPFVSGRPSRLGKVRQEASSRRKKAKEVKDKFIQARFLNLEPSPKPYIV